MTSETSILLELDAEMQRAIKLKTQEMKRLKS